MRWWQAADIIGISDRQMRPRMVAGLHSLTVEHDGGGGLGPENAVSGTVYFVPLSAFVVSECSSDDHVFE
jgi:hypothetical protein